MAFKLDVAVSQSMRILHVFLDIGSAVYADTKKGPDHAVYAYKSIL
jgi:hypothetical protein